MKERDPLAAYNDDEKVSEWLMPPKGDGIPHSDSEDEVFPGETLTWRQVSEATGANPKRKKSTRLKTYKRTRKVGASLASAKGKELAMEEDFMSSSESSSSDGQNIEDTLGLDDGDD